MRVPALLAAALLAGCLAPAPQEAASTSPAAEEEPVAAQDVAAFRETNRTEEGLGGRAHTHDYWKGRDRVTLFDATVEVAPFPFLADGAARRATTRDLQPAPPGLVFEGTVAVEFLVRATTVAGLGPDAYPAPPMRVLYRSAADGPQEWREAGSVAVGEAVVVPVAPQETDMPHSTASLWVFRLVADGAQEFSANLTMVAVRGGEAPPWPGHPDFYAERRSRLVYDADASNREVGLVNRYYLYGDDRDWRFPDRLISWGTGHLDVFVNITRVEAPVPPDSAYLRVRNATQIYDAFSLHYDAEGREDLRTYHFVVPVDAAGMDSPYAPSSRWAFSLAVGYQGGYGAVFPSVVDYHLTVWAHAAEEMDAAKRE